VKKKKRRSQVIGRARLRGKWKAYTMGRKRDHTMKKGHIKLDEGGY